MKIGIWLAIFSGVFYGTSGVFGVHLIKEGLSLSDFLFWRYLVTVILLLPFLNSTQQWKDVVSKKGLQVIVISAIFYESSTVFYFYSAESIGSGLAMVLSCCYPFFVVLLDFLHGKKSPSKTTLKGLSVVILGIFLLSAPHNWNLKIAGIGWGVLCALGFGIYFYASQHVIKTISTTSGTFCICLGNLLIFACIATYYGDLQTPNTWHAICNIGGLAILATLLPLYFVFLSFRYIDSTKASILSVFEPIVTIILGLIFLNETITAVQWAGVVVVIIGAYVVQSFQDKADHD